MASGHFQPCRQNKFYVVFKGRQPGIYSSWIDCHAQVNKFKGTAFRSYDTLEEAEAAWSISLIQGVPKDYIQEDNIDASSSSAPANFGLNCIDERPSNEFIIQFSMQSMLQQACNTLQIEGPRYKRHDVTVYNGQTYFRFYGSLSTQLIGRPPVSMGRFATTEDKAREDVALLLLRRLLACSQRTIQNFNYHNISLYEQQIAKLQAENFDIIIENGLLKEELKAIKRKVVG